MKLFNKLLIGASCFLAFSVVSCSPSKTKIQILMSSDIHGMLVPFDYATDEDVTKKGSLSQIGSIIEKYRDNNILVIDCGDAIQGNYADMFVDKTKDVTHPMIEAFNKLKYDVFVTGNHEYNFGMDYLQKQIKHFNGTVLTGNVTKKGTYEPLADAFKVFNKGGVRVAVVGMTTPLITKWDGDKLGEWNITDPINETKKIVKTIKDNDLADIIVAAEHLGMPKEYGTEGTSCRDLANACPDIDVILGAHEHTTYEKEVVNGVLICENSANANTMMKIDIEINKGFAIKPKVLSKNSTKINVGEYSTNSTINEFAKPYDEAAKEDARTVIGKLEGEKSNPEDWMSPEYKIKWVPSTFLKPTPLVNIVNKVQLENAQSEETISEEIRKNIKVSSTAIGNYNANLKPGDIKKCSCSNIYKYSNTLYVLKMNYKQLKKYLEWTAQFYQQFISNDQEKDLTIAFSDSFNLFNYDMFTGVNYKINIDKKVGERIEELKWTDGGEISETEPFYIAVNNYRANTNLLTKGTVYDDDDTLPELVAGDVKQGKGIREMLVDYISGKTIRAYDYSSTNWEVKHTAWDETNRAKAIEMANADKNLIGPRNTKKITEADIK